MKQNYLHFLFAVLSCCCLSSCKKEYVEVVSLVPDLEIVDHAFFVDSVSIENLMSGGDYVEFDVRVYGNPMDQVTIEILLDDNQYGFNLEENHYRIEAIVPNTPFRLQVNIRSKEDWYEVLTSDTAYFATSNNVNSINYLYNHRKRWNAFDHIPTKDGGFAFLSYGTWKKVYNEDPYFHYQYLLNVNIFKTNSNGELLWREETWDLKGTSDISINGKIKTFENDDLLVVLGCEVRRYSSDGRLIWKYAMDAISEMNILLDAEIMDDGSIYAVGSFFEPEKGWRGRILHLGADGELKRVGDYSDHSEKIASFNEVCRLSSNELYIVGVPGDGKNISIVKVVDMEVLWVEEVVYEGYEDVSYTDLNIEATSVSELVFSAKIFESRAYASLVLRLDASANLLEGKVIEYFHVKDVAVLSDGAIYLNGANEYGMFPGYNRLFLLDKGLNIQKDVSFQGGYGASLGRSIQVLSQDRVSIFGTCAGLHWHSIFSN